MISEEIEVVPSTDLYMVLANTQLTFLTANYELLDNSKAGMIDNHVNIEMILESKWISDSDKKSKTLDVKSARLIIKDDGCGISKEELPKVLSPGAKARLQNDPLNEHHMGLKTSLMSLGAYPKFDKNGNIEHIEGFKISTKTIDSDNMYIVNKLKFGKISINIENGLEKFPNGHGTEIIVEKLKNPPKTIGAIKKMLAQIGYHYARTLLGAHGKKVHISLTLTEPDGSILKDNKGQLCKYIVQPILPQYKEGGIVVDCPLPSGRGNHNRWKAWLKFGWAPTDDEFELFPNDSPIRDQQHNHHNPGYIDNFKIDIIQNDNVIAQKDWSWIGLSEPTVVRYFRGKKPRAQIILEHGFPTVFTKTDIADSLALNELKEQVLEKIKPFIQPDKLNWCSETELKDKIEPKLITLCTNVKREASIGSYQLTVDFSLTRNGREEIWEVKKGSAGVDDVGQLLNYLIADSIKNPKKYGVLLASSFTDAARNYISDLVKIGYNIELMELSCLI